MVRRHGEEHRVVCESEILFDFQMGRGVMTDDHRRYTTDTDDGDRYTTDTDDHRRYTTTTDRQTVAHVIPYIAVYIARGIFYMLYCLFSIVSYRNNTVYAVGDVFL